MTDHFQGIPIIRDPNDPLYHITRKLGRGYARAQALIEMSINRDKSKTVETKHYLECRETLVICINSVFVKKNVMDNCLDLNTKLLG